MSGDHLDLDAIEDLRRMGLTRRDHVDALVAEVRRLREERAAIDLLDWPREAHRLQAALHFARGTIDDLSATVERLEGEARHD